MEKINYDLIYRMKDLRQLKTNLQVKILCGLIILYIHSCKGHFLYGSMATITMLPGASLIPLPKMGSMGKKASPLPLCLAQTSQIQENFDKTFPSPMMEQVLLIHPYMVQLYMQLLSHQHTFYRICNKKSINSKNKQSSVETN